MRHVTLQFTLTIIFCSLVSLTVAADTLIYNNSTYTGYSFTPAYSYDDIYDYGTSPGGLVKKFTFAYRNPYYITSQVRISFYEYPWINGQDPGYVLKHIYIDNLPASTSAYRTYEYTLPESDRFTLPNGYFGFSMVFSDPSTSLILASGGTGQGNELWEYISGYWYPFNFGSTSWAGLYMKIWTGPPINEITCDISGNKFNDTNGNGVWNAGEPALPGWNIYLDTNINGTYEESEPNVVTDPNGFYFFENQPSPATYRIREVIKDGWAQTLPGSSSSYQYIVTTEPNHVYGPYNFGNKVGSGTTVRINAIEDTYASSALPDTIYGSNNGFMAGMESTTEYQSFIKFDLSSIPKGQVITSAKLYLDGSFVTIPAPILGAFRISDSWDEDTLTWNNKPSAYDTTPIDQKTALIDVTTWTVTLDVDKDYASDEPYSVLIKRALSSPSNTRASFWSKEVDIPAWAPVLEIQYEPLFGGGSGEPEDPFQIWTAEQMNTIGLHKNRWDKSYKLMADISLAAYPNSAYKRIGTSSASGEYFAGTFDGNFHTISGFTSTVPQASSYIGIFGYAKNATLKNLFILSPTITDTSHTASYVGTLAGYASSCDVLNCRVDAGTVQGKNYVGGLFGFSTGSYIADCTASAAVAAVNYVGGFIGSASSAFSGGSNISSCYAAGSVTGTDYIAGFVSDSSNNVIKKCYSKSAVSGSTNVGGFSAYNANDYDPGISNVLNCFWDITASGQNTSAAGTGLTTTQMKDSSTYLNAGWDFTAETANGGSDDWAIPGANSYPVLWHQISPLPALPAFAGGNGTQATPYLIATVEQLNSIGHNYRLMDKYFKLTADLDLNGIHFYRIAQKPYAFTGSFDGNNHTISNLTLTEDPFTQFYFGFIGWLKGSNARVKNLTLTNPDVSDTWAIYTGGLVGYNQNATIEDCHIVNGTVRGWYNVGGLVGSSYWYAKVSRCSFTGTVTEGGLISVSGTGVGGLVGQNTFWSQIENSYAIADVFGDDMVGGLVGDCVIYPTITNCYSRGTLTATGNNVGGLFARSNGGTITNCYSSCKIQAAPASTLVGVLVGRDTSSGIFTGCLWDSQINGALPGFGQTAASTQLINTHSDTTANMHLAATFTAKSWDFTNIWTICEVMSYPKFKWHIPINGDFVCPDGVGVEDFVQLAKCWNSVTQLQADISGDQWVDLEDVAGLGQYWMRIGCSACGGKDITGDGNVNMADLELLLDEWMLREIPACSVADFSGDGLVGTEDLMSFCDNWLLQR